MFMMAAPKAECSRHTRAFVRADRADEQVSFDVDSGGRMGEKRGREEGVDVEWMAVQKDMEEKKREIKKLRSDNVVHLN